MSEKPEQNTETMEQAADRIIVVADRLAKGIGLREDDRAEALTAAMNLWANTRPCQQCGGGPINAFVAQMGNFSATEDTTAEEIAKAHEKIDPWKLRQAADILESKNEE
jgi:hypothetical protein